MTPQEGCFLLALSKCASPSRSTCLMPLSIMRLQLSVVSQIPPPPPMTDNHGDSHQVVQPAAEGEDPSSKIPRTFLDHPLVLWVLGGSGVLRQLIPWHHYCHGFNSVQVKEMAITGDNRYCWPGLRICRCPLTDSRASVGHKTKKHRANTALYVCFHAIS